jgi:chromosome segregation ATPase
MQDDNAAIDFETQTLQRTLDKEVEARCRLEGAKQALEARVAQLGATQAELKMQVETLQGTLDQELEAKSRLEDCKEALEARMAQLTSELGATQSELETQAEDLADCREKLAEALCKAAKLYAEAADLQQSLEHETVQRQQERAELTNERQAAQTERDVLVNELNAATRELDLAKSEHASLVLKLKEEHMRVRGELEAKLLSLTDQLATAQEEHEEVKIEVKKVSAQRSSAALLHKEEQERRELQERERQVCASVSIFVPALVCARSAEHHTDTRVYRYACPGLLAHRHSHSHGRGDVPLCRALCYAADACQCVQSQEVELALNDFKVKVRLHKSRELSAQKPRASHARSLAAPLLDT